MKKNASPRRRTRARELSIAFCVLLGLALLHRPMAAQAHESVLIITSGKSDEAAARRVQELLDVPTTLLEPDLARSDIDARTLFAETGASYAVVLSTTQGRVQVFGAGGAQHTRTFPPGAQITPYEIAFVATELLAIARQERPTHATVVAPRRIQIAGRAALELAGFYRDLTMTRPAISFDLRPRLGSSAMQRLVLGAALGFPGRHERQLEGVDFVLVRWDTQLRLGFALDLVHTRILAVAQGRLARAGVEWSGAPDSEQHGTSLGLGLALEAELAVSSWFGLFASLGCDGMLRRNVYRIADLVAFQEERLAWSTMLGAVFTSPARAGAEPRAARLRSRAY